LADIDLCGSLSKGDLELPSSHGAMRLRAHILMILVVIVWGTTFVLVKNALRDISPLLFNLLRMVLAFLVMALAYRKHWKHLTGRAWTSGAVVGLFLAMGYQFQTAGLARTTPSKSAFLTGLVVVLVPLLSTIPWLRAQGAHPPRWNTWLGALAAFFGILLLTTPAGSGMNLTFIGLGDVLSLVCALGFAFHCLALSHTAPRVPFKQLALLQIGFCAVFMGVTTPFLERPFFHPSSRLFIALAIAALLATAAAFSVQSWAQSILPATHTALILTLEPVFAWITSFLVLGERSGFRSGAGALLILAGIGVTELLPTAPPATAHEFVETEAGDATVSRHE
jgi:drug/metabolite transporter (DMT)-like permease